jgi:hypothetical protein
MSPSGLIYKDITVANERDGGSDEGGLKESSSWFHAGNAVCSY